MPNYRMTLPVKGYHVYYNVVRELE
jgi:hypothetical protein